MTKPQAGILMIAALLIGLNSQTAAQQPNVESQTIPQSGDVSSPAFYQHREHSEG